MKAQSSQPDYELWGEADFFNFWDACYLWCDLNPPIERQQKRPSQVI